jgi:Ca2+-binding EF-hand superfamily protein
MREEELLKRFHQATSTELLEEICRAIRRGELDQVPDQIFSKLDRSELEELHFETLLKIIRTEIQFEKQGFDFERLFHLFVMLMLNDGFEIVDWEKA